MIKVLINGCNGKMGQEVAKIVNSDNDCVLVGGIDKENTGEYTFPVYTSVDEINEEADVIIDFSIPSFSPSKIPFSRPPVSSGRIL